MPNLKDITGIRYGKLTAIKRSGHKNGRVAWLCRCECGNLRVVKENQLQQGHIKSCKSCRKYRGYPEDFRERVIREAEGIGLVKAAERNNIAPLTLINWCKKRGISFKRLGKKQECPVCGKIFTGKHHKKRVCCSNECKMEYVRITISCAHCGKPFRVLRSAKPRKYCSRKCYYLASRKEKQIPKRRGSNWATIRRRFKESPRPCEVCGDREATDLHHIIPYKYFKGNYTDGNDPTNLAALCMDCHHVAEKRVRFVMKTIEEFEDKVTEKVDGTELIAN